MSPAKTTSPGSAGPKPDPRRAERDVGIVGDSSEEPANTGTRPADSASTAFLEALAAYYRTVEQSWRREDVEQQTADAYAAVLEALQGTPDVAEVQQRALRAQRNLTERIREASTTSDAPQQLAQAYADYVSELSEVSATRDIRERVNAAYEVYLQVLLDASSMRDVQANTASAYDDYLRALRDAWSSVNPDELDIDTLAIIAQSIMAAALAHASTLSAIGQVALANPAATAAGSGQETNT